ncbi:hypothetical protein [Nocardioides bigeumensis]|uniref:hypothetical protein n=1 Tax=Nocardioides bigeumensis TaxID=433657 RepID=UPI0031E0083A
MLEGDRGGRDIVLEGDLVVLVVHRAQVDVVGADPAQRLLGSIGTVFADSPSNGGWLPHLVFTTSSARLFRWFRVSSAWPNLHRTGARMRGR